MSFLVQYHGQGLLEESGTRLRAEGLGLGEAARAAGGSCREGAEGRRIPLRRPMGFYGGSMGFYGVIRNGMVRV